MWQYSLVHRVLLPPSLPPSLSALSFLNTQERLTPLRTPEKVIIINEELKESD